MKKLLLSIAILLLPNLCMSAESGVDISESAELGTAVSGDFIVGGDSSASGAKLRRILLDGDVGKCLSGAGTWIDCVTSGNDIEMGENDVNDIRFLMFSDDTWLSPTTPGYGYLYLKSSNLILNTVAGESSIALTSDLPSEVTVGTHIETFLESADEAAARAAIGAGTGTGGDTVTVQAADPTSASATGWYAATGSGDIFYKSDDGLFTIAGTYAADPASGTLTVSPASWDPADGTTSTSDASQTLTVTATGDVTFTSYALTTGTYFADAGTGTCTGTSSLSDNSCTIDLIFQYDTGAVTDHSDTLTITSNATDSPETVSMGPVTVTAGATSSFLDDSLFESTSTAIASHTPETGGVWSVVGSDAVSVHTGGAYTFNNFEGFVRNAAPHSSQDYTVEAEVVTNADGYAGPCLRVTASGDGYCALVSSGGNFGVYEYSGGSYLGELGTGGTIPDFTTSTVYTVKIVISGSDIDAYAYNGVTLKRSITDASDSTITTGDAGFIVQDDTARVTNIEAYE